MIKITDLCKKYGDFLALDRVNFSVRGGKITALLGPNGAGKTTTMKILTGFFAPDFGKVEIDGEVVNSSNLREIQQKIGYLPENAPLHPELNVWEHLDFSAKIHEIDESEREKRIRRVAKMCGLSEKLFHDISELSKGYRQRVGLAQAIVHDPEILILDEPTTGLDPNQILEIRDLILSWREKKTILLSTHIMQEVEALADEVIVIDRGRVVAAEKKSEMLAGNESACRISVEVGGGASGLKKAMKILEKITEISSISSSDAKISCSASGDCRAEISRVLVQEGCDLMNISVEKASMESVFVELTGGGSEK